MNQAHWTDGANVVLRRLPRLLKALLVLWAVAAVVGYALHRSAAGGVPPTSGVGWTGDAGLWNLVVAVILVQVLLRGGRSMTGFAAWSLVLLALFMGTNHAAEVLRGIRGAGHVIWAAANYMGALFGAMVLLWSRRGLGRD